MINKAALCATTLSLALVFASPAFADTGNGNGSYNTVGRDLSSTVTNNLTKNSQENDNSQHTKMVTDSYNTPISLSGISLTHSETTLTADQELSAEITNKGDMNFDGGNAGDAAADAAKGGNGGSGSSGTSSGGNGGNGSAAAASGGNGTANYASGSNSVSGAAYAAYSGILNQGWNTGINAQSQAATNIAALGTVTFATH